MSGKLAKGFLDDIVANIDDDTPRLVYADWLIENGQEERAEFIRVQIERAHRPSWDPEQVRLRLREQELLQGHGEAWLAELPAVKGMRWEGFRRGIIAEASFVSFEAMRASAHACRAVAPVEAITVPWPRKRESTKAAQPIAELRELQLVSRPFDKEVARLADSPQLSTLRTLGVIGLDATDLGRLTISPHLTGLRVLRLTSNGLGTGGVQALTQAATLRALEELDLSGPGYYEQYYEDPLITATGMELLAGWAGLAHVRSLTLSGSDVRRPGLRALLQSPHALALQELSLRGGRLDEQSAAEFADAQAGLRLQKLDVGGNLLKEQGAASLASAVCLGELKELRLDRCEIPLAGARHLAKAAFLDGLRLLDVGHNTFGPAGLLALLEREPPALRTLGLRDNDLFDKGAASLAGSPASNVLLEVDLSRNSLTDAGALALSETEHLRELLVLRLTGNRINEWTFSTLKSSPLGQRLRLLEMDGASLRAGDDDIPF